MSNIRTCLLKKDAPLPYSSRNPLHATTKDHSNDQMLSQNNADTSWQRRAKMTLLEAHRAKQTITYAELADAASIPNPYRIHKLTSWLESCIRIDHAKGEPLRAALVVSRKRGGLPAPGFFILCRDLGLYQGAESGRCAAEFHRTMITKLWQKFDT